jgi:phasin
LTRVLLPGRMVTLIWVKAPIMQLAPDADTFEQLRPHGPKLREGLGEVQALFERILEQTFWRLVRRARGVGVSQARESVMSEQVISADKVRAMLTENLEKVRKASDEYFKLLEQGLGSSQLPIASQAKPFTDFMQRNVAATFDLCDKLINAKDPQDALRIQSEFFQTQMRVMTDQARSMGETAMKAMTGAFMPRS